MFLKLTILVLKMLRYWTTPAEMFYYSLFNWWTVNLDTKVHSYTDCGGNTTSSTKVLTAEILNPNLDLSGSTSHAPPAKLRESVHLPRKREAPAPLWLPCVLRVHVCDIKVWEWRKWTDHDDAWVRCSQRDQVLSEQHHLSILPNRK